MKVLPVFVHVASVLYSGSTTPAAFVQPLASVQKRVPSSSQAAWETPPPATVAGYSVPSCAGSVVPGPIVGGLSVLATSAAVLPTCRSSQATQASVPPESTHTLYADCQAHPAAESSPVQVASSVWDGQIQPVGSPGTPLA